MDVPDELHGWVCPTRVAHSALDEAVGLSSQSVTRTRRALRKTADVRSVYHSIDAPQEEVAITS